MSDAPVPASDELEDTARRIAAQGRDALIARLRPAFEEAAASHADLVTVDHERLERMVQNAADRADGLQWRRALAGIASEELGIGLGAALAHPAVARAQELVRVRSEPQGVRSEPEGVRSEPVGLRSEPEPQAVPAPRRLVLPATHLSGVPPLGEREENVQLRIDDGGVEVARDGDVVARFGWAEVQAVDVPMLRRRLPRRRAIDARLSFLRAVGEASFEIPGVSPDELDEQISPIIAERR
jgi:hypothetical protein